jgi:hypothetical protein
LIPEPQFSRIAIGNDTNDLLDTVSPDTEFKQKIELFEIYILTKLWGTQSLTEVGGPLAKDHPGRRS